MDPPSLVCKLSLTFNAGVAFSSPPSPHVFSDFNIGGADSGREI